mmetsp:Transcript_17448/g.22724  ORF Transcript_17448/g.22724 Transcript_17448/m.22724 type:complete len:241 (+) Transcript_17448:74-796(+)|eukprot:CAMPEP_0197291128 /NCGR_PEP_ID=MMETSP0890-20130614/11686_1 /TAXON_ID=44058 ORGANISM="Aureoumbra lagunensis, Strain CCMP1510" /NCGR_SAMPLE_ID=MMETSP0890 /ASSEMBLY_ACC=CAM_ASM_000533 /LENGTH=240 /DNA_ID=CAMNT_0042763721 /DNA_START=67 /DNA_END=789 /DNA_ORIENTATION=+
MNKIFVVRLALLVQSTIAFVVSPTTLGTVQPQKAVSTKLNAYVPDGLTPEQWKKMKAKEEADRKQKNFGAGGARGFKSRSMQSFMLAYERGEAQHLFPVDPQEVKKGKIALKDVPYMQRGGSWDNSDLQGKRGWMKTGFGMTAFNDGKAKKLNKNKFDDKYNNLKPSLSIFGTDIGINWTGKGGVGDSVAARAKKNGISNDQQMWRDAGALSVEEARKLRGGAPKIGAAAAEKKKIFGLF